MELTYKILGGDGQEYGPGTLAQVQTWIDETRIDAQTKVARSDQTEWRSAADFEEFVWPTAAQSASVLATEPTVLPQPLAAALPALENRVKSGANWFFWIAGLSAINSVSALSGSDWGFVLGLSVTRIFDALGREVGAAAVAVAAVLDLLAIGLVVLFGVFARKGHNWSFIIGMVLYALDSLLALLFQDWIGFGFHVFALFCVFAGFKANRELKALQRGSAA